MIQPNSSYLEKEVVIEKEEESELDEIENDFIVHCGQYYCFECLKDQ